MRRGRIQLRSAWRHPSGRGEASAIQPKCTASFRSAAESGSERAECVSQRASLIEKKEDGNIGILATNQPVRIPLMQADDWECLLDLSSCSSCKILEPDYRAGLDVHQGCVTDANDSRYPNESSQEKCGRRPAASRHSAEYWRSLKRANSRQRGRERGRN